MECLHPIAPDAEELLRFALDGEALPEEVSRHLQECSHCQQRLANYKLTHASLVSGLYRSQCPGSIKLSLYCADLLPPGERLNIAQHTQDCPLCATEAVDARQFLAIPDKDLLPPSLFSLNGLHVTAHRILATLVKQQAQLVVRNDTVEETWPRQFHADSIDLSLHLSRASSGEYMLLGIITDPAESIEGFTGMTAELYPAIGGKDTSRAETPLLSEQIDDLGNIVFSAVPLGEYVMIVHLPKCELVIERLNLQPG